MASVGIAAIMVVSISLASVSNDHIIEQGRDTVILQPVDEDPGNFSLVIRLELDGGERIVFSWESTHNITFQIGVPPDYPDDEGADGNPQFWVKRGVGLSSALNATVKGSYSLSWANQFDVPSELTYSYRVED